MKEPKSLCFGWVGIASHSTLLGDARHCVSTTNVAITPRRSGWSPTRNMKANPPTTRWSWFLHLRPIYGLRCFAFRSVTHPKWEGQPIHDTVVMVPSPETDLRSQMLRISFSHPPEMGRPTHPRHGGHGSFIIDRFTVNGSPSLIQSSSPLIHLRSFPTHPRHSGRGSFIRWTFSPSGCSLSNFIQSCILFGHLRQMPIYGIWLL